MRTYLCVFAAFLLFVCGHPILASRQSLGDLARQQEERRKTVKEAGKVLTNKDVPRVPQSTAPSAAVPVGRADAAKATPDDAEKVPGAAAPATSAAVEPVKDQKYWSERQSALHDQLS